MVLRLGWVVVRACCLLTLDDWRLWLEVDLDTEERCCEEDCLLTDAELLLEEDCLLTEALERDDVLGRDCIDEERDGDAAEREAPPPPDEPRLTDEEERDAPPPPPRD